MSYEWESEQIDNMLEEPEQSSTKTTPEEIDDLMNEAERRFEVAQYYKLLLQDNLFENKTEASERVEQEIRSFIRERLAVLLGIKQPKSSNSEVFTEDQVSVLKDFADLGSEAPDVVRAVMGRLAKKIDKKVTKQKEEPQLRAVKEPPRPSLKKRDEPRAKMGTARPESKPSRELSGKVKVPKKYQDDPTLKIENNKVFVQNRNSNGELLWEKIGEDVRPLWKDVTPVTIPVGVKPTPIPTGNNLINAMQNLLPNQTGSDNQLVADALK